MRGLLHNEFTKVLKQTGYRIILIIFAIFVVATPFIGLAEKEIFNYDNSPDELREMYISNAKFYEEIGDPLGADYWYRYADAVKFFIDNALPEWKFRYLFEGDVSVLFPNEDSGADTDTRSFAQYYLRAHALELLAEGEYSEANLWDSAYYSCIYDYFASDTYYFDGDSWCDSVGNVIANPHTSGEISALLQSASEDLATIKDMIISCDATNILSEYTERTETLVNRARFELEALRLSGASEGEISSAERRLEYYGMADEMFRKLKSETTSLDDWRFDFSVAFLNSYSTISDYSLYAVSYEEFLENRINYYYEYEKYDDYLAYVERTVADTEAGVKVAHYAVMNNIAPEGVDSTVKKDVRTQIVSISGFVLIFSVVLASMIVASEFSSGTVRLLLIRPKKRWKILLSKLACVLLLHVALIVMGTVVIVGLNVAISGVGDLFAPDLSYVGGSVTEVASVLETLYTVALVIIQALPVISLAFALSTLMKKSVLALVISLVVQSLSSIVQMVACALIADYAVLRYTILPYLTLVDLRFSASDVVINNINYSIFDLGSLLGTTTALAGGAFDPVLAIAIVIVHALALIAIAFGLFRKQQI
ncbi:MAG: ABC transporter permease [Eubacteriales bacterium]